MLRFVSQGNYKVTYEELLVISISFCSIYRGILIHRNVTKLLQK